MKIEDIDFPNCMHVLAAGFHMNGIDPADVTITLPDKKWWDLACLLESRFRGFLVFDGRAPQLEKFRYMGFNFVREVKK